MKRSADYALTCLDGWVHRRIQETYTTDVASAFTNGFKQRMREFFEGEEGLEELVEEAVVELSREKVLASTKHLFTRNYTAGRDAIRQIQSQLQETKPALIAEYVAPYTKLVEELDRLVEGVRQRADEFFPDDIPDEEITALMRKQYKDAEEYVEYLRRGNEAQRNFIEIARRERMMDEESAQGMLLGIEVSSPINEEMGRLLFDKLSKIT